MISKRRIITRVLTILPLIVCLLISCKNKETKNPLDLIKEVKFTNGNIVDVISPTTITYSYEQDSDGIPFVNYHSYLLTSVSDSQYEVKKLEKSGYEKICYYTKHENAMCLDSFVFRLRPSLGDSMHALHPEYDPARFYSVDTYEDEWLKNDFTLNLKRLPFHPSKRHISKVDTLNNGLIRIISDDPEIENVVLYHHPFIGLISGIADKNIVKLRSVETETDTITFSDSFYEALYRL